MSLKNDSTMLCSLLASVFIFFSGCNKSAPPDEDEIAHRVTVRFCAKMMADPTASERVKSLAKNALLNRENGTVDPEPILIRVGLDRLKRVGPGLIVGASDEDGDLVGVVVRESYGKSSDKPLVIEEEYPIFGNRVEKAAYYRFFPVVIRKANERKNEQDWKAYLANGPWDAEHIPNLWISVPDPGKVDVEIWIHDREGHKSAPVNLENWMASDQNAEN